MLWLLRAHGGLSTADLARRLEVSRRTVLRDVEALSAAGIPVYCERGPHGGVRLLPGYRLDVNALTEDESRALLAAASSWGADSLGLGEAFTSGLRKLLAAVPETGRSRGADAAERVVIDPRGWMPQPEATRPGQAFTTVQEAVFARQQLDITYRSGRTADVQQVTVEPHGLVSAGSDWYLCAGEDGAVRFFKVARILSAAAQTEACWDDVDVASAWQEYRDRFLAGFTPVTVTGWLQRDRWQDASEWSMRLTDRESATDPPEEGWRPVRMEFLDDLHALTVLLRLGPAAHVESPERIRTRLLDHVEQVAGLYRR